MSRLALFLVGCNVGMAVVIVTNVLVSPGVLQPRLLVLVPLCGLLALAAARLPAAWRWATLQQRVS